MSTTFAIIRNGKPQDMESDGYDGNDVAEVAYRGNIGGIAWINTDIEVLVSHLPDSTKVFPLDNTAQGITTIGDIWAKMAKQ
jgi:hypothetical protein